MERKIKLVNGVWMDRIGLGTWKLKGNEAYQSVGMALKHQYRFIDTAAKYENETEVGRAILESGIAREEIFVTTKLWNEDQGYENTMKAFQDSLNRLSLEYLDLYLIHWPVSEYYFDSWESTLLDTWRAFEDLYASGKVRAIGVCNCKPHHLDLILEHARVMPMVNQIELHPGMEQNETYDYCKKHQIVVEAWSPLASGRALNCPELDAIAHKYQKTVVQVSLRYLLQIDVVVIPRSSNEMHILENIDIYDFELTNEEIEVISKLQLDNPSGLDPDWQINQEKESDFKINKICPRLYKC